ncbi:hypothetical protein DMN91_005788 [Ooceraea biroi]|uniref:Follicle cell protein 3C-1 n=1 Tax=Ooceraea biroi TaxID=2015173 RepID=A0A3L8DLW0_OOCBI|nr:hypothetical protein DMN91_005788 [Ooceraea biroi]
MIAVRIYYSGRFHSTCSRFKVQRGAMGKLVMVYFVILIITLPFTLQKEVAEGACGCALFTVPGTDPVVEETLQYNVSCNEEGTMKCQELCNALAYSSHHKAPMIICEKLNTRVEKLKVYLKICNMEPWKFTGLESAQPICCRDGKAVLCNEAM